MTLRNMPSRTKIFLDTNVLVFHFTRAHPLSEDCTALLQRIATRDVVGITSATVVAELLHRMMIVEAVERKGFQSSREAVEYLQATPAFVKTLKKHFGIPSALARMRVDIKLVDHIDLHTSKRFRQEHGFMTNDSLVLAVMRRFRINDLATNDPDFQQVPQIRVWTPSSSSH